MGIAGKTLNPYQGLKLLTIDLLNLHICRKNPKSLSGIETCWTTANIAYTSRKNPKSLSGIETRELVALGYGRVESRKNPKSISGIETSFVAFRATK